MTGGGFALSIFGPLELIWLWTGLLGLGQGSLTAVALTMIMVRTRDGHTAAHLSGMMQGVGYGVGSTGTLLVGQLHQATGSFAAAGVLFLAGRLAGRGVRLPRRRGTASSAADARRRLSGAGRGRRAATSGDPAQHGEDGNKVPREALKLPDPSRASLPPPALPAGRPLMPARSAAAAPPSAPQSLRRRPDRFVSEDGDWLAWACPVDSWCCFVLSGAVLRHCVLVAAVFPRV